MKKFSSRIYNKRIRRLGVEGSIFILLQPRYSILSKEFFPLLPMFFLSFSFNSIKPFVYQDPGERYIYLVARFVLLKKKKKKIVKFEIHQSHLTNSVKCSHGLTIFF